jgi:hypothetical protein
LEGSGSQDDSTLRLDGDGPIISKRSVIRRYTGNLSTVADDVEDIRILEIFEIGASFRRPKISGNCSSAFTALKLEMDEVISSCTTKRNLLCIGQTYIVCRIAIYVIFPVGVGINRRCAVSLATQEFGCNVINLREISDTIGRRSVRAGQSREYFSNIRIHCVGIPSGCRPTVLGTPIDVGRNPIETRS